MPRIRTIKPEFWADEKMSLLDPLTRLVFLGLISMADDAGRVVDSIKQLDGQIFPNTDDSCVDPLETLARLGRIVRYTSGSGQALIQIAKWADHQRVEHPSKHTLPAPTAEDLTRTASTSQATLTRTSRESLSSILDLGPTTNDLRPTTERAKRGAGSTENWVSEFGDDWRRVRRGKPPFALIGRELKELHREYGHESLHAAWLAFLSSEKAQYGVPYFARNCGDFLGGARGPPQNGAKRYNAGEATFNNALAALGPEEPSG